MDVISELLATTPGADKLGSPEISIEKTQQLLANRNVIVANPGRRRPARERARRRVIGRTDGGRTLTLVVERPAEPTTWVLVTG